MGYIDFAVRPVFLLLSHRSPGLAQDRMVVANLLSSMGHEVYSYELPPAYYLQGLPVPIPDDWKSRAIAIMFEHVFVFSRPLLACLLYANPEWIVEQDRARIEAGNVDVLLAKTHHAHQRLAGGFASVQTVYTGFASLSLPKLSVRMDYDKAIHIRGYASQKGTATIMKAYQGATNGLPECVCTMRTFDPAVPPFVSKVGSQCTVVFRDIQQSALDRMASRRGLHLCPSEREGFGHYIFGPMSLGAVVLTVDAPPMNELVDASCGLLVPARIEDRELYVNATASASDLAEALRSYVAMGLDEKRDMGRKAIEKAAAMRADFEQRFKIFVALLLSTLPLGPHD